MPGASSTFSTARRRLVRVAGRTVHTEAPGHTCQHRSEPTVPQPSATFSVSLILGICFCASLYAAAVRKPRECSAAASPGARRVERSACTFGRWRVAGAVVALIVMGGCRWRAVRLAGERARGWWHARDNRPAWMGRFPRPQSGDDEARRRAKRKGHDQIRIDGRSGASSRLSTT